VPPVPAFVPAPITEKPAAWLVDLPSRLPPGSEDTYATMVEAGFSEAAAEIVARSPHGSREPIDALGRFLDSRTVEYPEEGRTALVTMTGPAGSGRTTALLRMAIDCADAGRPAVLLAADTSHVGSREQIHAYGEAIGLPVLDAYSLGEIARTLARAPRGACVFADIPADTPGHELARAVPSYPYLALPALWRPDLLRDRVGPLVASTKGAVLTFTDVATNLTPLLSLLIESPLGLAFLSSGRDVGTGIAVAGGLTIASGILTSGTGETTDGRLVASA
jgi:flagellar biosynthesis GTPase FlhF